MNDKFLFKLRRPPRPEFVEALYERISQEKSGIPAFANLGIPAWFGEKQGRRWAGVGIGIALVLTLILGFTPAGTWAQGVLQTIRSRVVIGTTETVNKGFRITFPLDGDSIDFFSDEERLQENAGFPLLWPTELPFDQRHVAFSSCLIPTENGVWIEGSYGNMERSYLELHVFWRQRPSIEPTENAWLIQFYTSPVTVAGHQGLWSDRVPAHLIERVLCETFPEEIDTYCICQKTFESFGVHPRTEHCYCQGPLPENSENVNVLLWEEKETLYVLVDPERQFSQADLLQTAESMYGDH